MRIIELLIDELDKLSGVDAVALVETPAIEADFFAFNDVNVEDLVVKQIIEKELFVERRIGESQESYIGRCIPVLKGEGYDEDQAAAICYDGLKKNNYDGHRINLPVDETTILQAEGENRGLRVNNNSDRSYDVAYWYKDDTQPMSIEVELDGKPVGYHENIHLKFHPFLGKEEDYDHHEDDHKKLYVSVIKTDDGKKYVIDDTLLPELHLEIDKKYCIDQCDESNQDHPMRLSITPDGIHNGGKAYLGIGTEEIEYELDKIHFTPQITTPKQLYYYCVNHPGMGGKFDIVRPSLIETIEEEYEFESYTDYPQSATNAAKRALEWKESHPDNDCGTRVGWARANQLADRRPISEETIARMASFARHLQYKDVPYSEGCGGLMVDAWGGEAAINWAKGKLEKIREGLTWHEKRAKNLAFTGKNSKFKFAMDEDEQMVVGPLMIPDKLILRIDENDDPYYVFFSKKTIQDIAFKLMKEKRLDSVNVEHDMEQKVDGYMVSSWIVEDSSNDKQNIYGFNFPEGTWMGQYKIENEGVWDMVRSGDLKGFSVEGFFQDKFIQASKN